MKAKARPIKRAKVKREKPPTGYEPLEPGTVVGWGVVPGRAVPWKAPTIGRRGAYYDTPSQKAFERWKSFVNTTSKSGLMLPEPYGGPVMLTTVFYLQHKGRMPDLTNLLKAFEDGLEGAIIRNDSQVRIHSPESPALIYDERERVEWRVVAISETEVN